MLTSSSNNQFGNGGTPAGEPQLAGQGAPAPIEAPVLLQSWHVVLRWKWVIAGVLVASLVAGVIVTLLSTPQFRATSRIEISREQKKVTNVQGLDSEEEGRDQEFYQTQYSLLQARSLAERVERELKLGTNNAFFASHGVNPDKNALFSEDTKVLTASERARRSKMAISLLLDHVVISPIARSRLIDVSYRSASPELAAAIANAWVNQFIAANMDRRFASTADARKYLENRLNDLRTKLRRTSSRSGRTRAAAAPRSSARSSPRISTRSTPPWRKRRASGSPRRADCARTMRAVPPTMR